MTNSGATTLYNLKIANSIRKRNRNFVVNIAVSLASYTENEYIAYTI